MIDTGNHWHSKVSTFLKQVASPDWCWTSNSRFKYLNIRVDTRNGRFLIFDDQKRRVDIEQVLWQYSDETPEPPTSEHYPNDESSNTTSTKKPVTRLDYAHG